MCAASSPNRTLNFSIFALTGSTNTQAPFVLATTFMEHIQVDTMLSQTAVVHGGDGSLLLPSLVHGNLSGVLHFYS